VVPARASRPTDVPSRRNAGLRLADALRRLTNEIREGGGAGPAIGPLVFMENPMPAHPKQLLPASPEALFRFQVVSAVLAHMAGGQVRSDAVCLVADQHWLDDCGELRRVSTRSVYRWLKAWNEAGAEGLEPRSRQRTETSEVLPKALLEFITLEHGRDPMASIPEILRRARQRGVIAPDATIVRSSVWRATKRMGLDFRRRKKSRGRDARRFRFPHRMQLILSDGKHYRAGAGRLKRVVLFFLDNATRYGLNAVVGTSENTALFLRGLHGVVRRHGLMDIVYLDHGPGFIALDTVEVVKKLNALLIHGESKYPAAHGAVERLNQTAKGQLLRNWEGNPAIDPACEALELRAKHFLREVYNHTPHGGLNGETPHMRWQKDPRALRFPKDAEDLSSRFLIEDTRRVSADHVISVDGVAYEVPRGLAGARIRFWRHAIEGHLYVLHEEHSVQIHPVDLVANATSRRGGRCTDLPTTSPAPVPSAADLAYQRDFGSVTGPDGGFTDEESLA